MKKIYIFLLFLIVMTGCKQTINKKADLKQAKEFFLQADNSSSGKQVLSKSEVKKIGVLLPIGRAIGKPMMDAMLLALYEIGDNTVGLRLFDTEDKKNDPQHLKSIIEEESVKLILGPIYGKESLELANWLKENSINVISFSNDPTLYAENLYLMGITPQAQLNTILGYGLENEYNNYFLLLPSTPKGKFYASYLKRFLAKNEKAQINGIEYYAEDMNGLEASCKNILDKIKATSGKKILFFSDNKLNMQKLIEKLNIYGVNSYQELQLITTEEIEDLNYLSVKDLKNVKFAGPSLKMREDFKRRFKKTFGYEPTMLASLAYDSVALAVNLINSDFPEQSIKNNQGFYGINGLFRFKDTKSLAERILAILEYQEGRLNEINSSETLLYEE